MMIRAMGPALLAACLVAAGCSVLPQRSELGRIMREDDVARLMQDLRADRAWVREHVAVRLGQLEAVQAISELEDRLQSDPDPWVRARSAQALGLIRSPESVHALSEARADESVDVRLAVAAALGNIGGPAAEDALLFLMEDRNLLVRGAAREVLELQFPGGQ